MKKKILAAVLAATATLAFAGFGTGCNIKNKIDEWTCNHVYNDGEVTLAPTCSETGEIKYTCLDCGKTYTEEIESLPHTYDSGMITTEPTCTETGVRTQLCVDCGAEKTSTVAKTEHTPVTVAMIAPTCETVGYTEWQYCGDCDIVLVPSTQIAALGHTEVTDIEVSPTCTTLGKTSGVHCGTCGKTLVEQKTVQALGHTSVEIAGKSPTCTETGLTAGSYCSVCDTVLVEQTVLDMIGHTSVEIAGKSPTCAETGLSAGSYCGVCNAVLVEQTVLAKTDIHVDNNIDSYCDLCGFIDFEYYQDTANYDTQEYVAYEKLDGKVARLRVATTADDGTIQTHSFSYVTSGVISLRYNFEKDVFDYTWSGMSDVAGNGVITHDDVQYSAFEVDGEYYVDVYFTRDITLSLCDGVSVDENGENLIPHYTNVCWGELSFPGTEGVKILRNIHTCVDFNIDNVCDICGCLPNCLSGNTYRMNYKFTAKEKFNALKALRSTSTLTICRRYKVSRVTLWRWKMQFDGRIESLEPKFSRKHIHHPNEQTDEEKTNIKNLVRRNPEIGLNELYGKLYRDYGYRRNPATLYRFLRKNDMKESTPRQAYKPKPYNTPIEIGEKWQLDVKYVPLECYSGNGACERCYQYTVIDECTRKRYIRAYKEQSQESTIDFILRAFKFFGYKPKTIQTDNGQEFTFLRWKTKDGRIHKFDRLCFHFGIEHKLIRPRTPRHNGKVERSHRSDNERFYRYLHYYSFDDLQAQMSVYLRRSNNIPTSVLRSQDDKRRWLSPNEKEQELLSS